MIEQKNIVFFDGVCNFCNGSVDFIWNNNSKRNIYYSSLQSDFAKRKLQEHKIDVADLSTIYYLTEGKIYKKSEAVFKIMKSLNSFYPLLGSVLSIFPTFICDAVYTFIAKNRYKIAGQKDICRIPSEEERRFFFS